MKKFGVRHMTTPRCALSMIVVGSLHASAWAQSPCEEWLAGEPSSGPMASRLISAMIDFDPDGDGPIGTVLGVFGEFTLPGAVPPGTVNAAYWDGVRWLAMNQAPFLNGSQRQARAVTLHDFDGDGPATPQLVMGMDFSSPFPNGVRYVARWDGQNWLPLGNVLARPVLALASFDPDGSGPLPPSLYAGGDFRLGNTNVARWNGSTWEPLPGLISGAVHALAVLDPDGPGPESSSLFVGGAISSVNGNGSIRGVARWDGQSWHTLGTPSLTGTVYALSTIDPDLAGPQPTQLLIGGDFMMGATISHIARLEGTTWRALGVSLGRTVRTFTHFDPDGDGPAPRYLAAGGSFSGNFTIPFARVALWDGVAWLQPGAGFQSSSVGVQALHGASVAGRRVLLAGGDFSFSGTLPLSGFAAWNPEGEWSTFANGLNNYARSLLAVDFDGDGPQAPRLMASGLFTFAGPTALNGLGAFDGQRWQPLGTGGTSVNSLGIFDPDGDGPIGQRLLASGVFTQIGGVSAQNVAMWDGSTWSALGTGVTEWARDAVGYDADGTGPMPPVVAVAALTTSDVANQFGSVMTWDGTNWTNISGPIRYSNGTPFLNRLFSFDPDGEGPDNPLLILTGAFSNIGGVAASYVAAWDGTVWRSLQAPIENNSQVVISHDQDGSGPQRPLLLVVGFGGNSPNFHSRVQSWNGTSWRQLGGVFTTDQPFSFATVNGLASVDLDGTGPDTPVLFATGSFTACDGLPLRNFAWFDGSAWRPVGDGLASGSALASFDPDGSGPLTPRLAASGAFTLVGNNLASAFFAQYAKRPGCCDNDYNQDGGADLSDTLSLGADVASGTRSFPPNSTDVNNDGTADITDVFDLADAIAGNGCP